jgi:hypothetical protein
MVTPTARRRSLFLPAKKGDQQVYRVSPVNPLVK